MRVGLSKISILLGLWLVISASFMLQVLKIFRALTGPAFADAYIKLLLSIAATAAACLIVLGKKLPAIRVMAASLAVTIGFLTTKQMEIAAEKIHILEYALLGWFAIRDTMRQNSAVRGVLFACGFCLLVGLLDEAFQAVLPYRVFAWQDIKLNIFGGLEGIVLYILRESR